MGTTLNFLILALYAKYKRDGDNALYCGDDTAHIVSEIILELKNATSDMRDDDGLINPMYYDNYLGYFVVMFDYYGSFRLLPNGDYKKD